MTTKEVEQILRDGVRELIYEDEDIRDHIANDRLLWERFGDDSPCPDDYGNGFGRWLAVTACITAAAAVVAWAVYVVMR